MRAINFIGIIADNVAFLQEYLLRVSRQEYRLQHRKERLLQEKAMIELEMRHVDAELAYCKVEAEATKTAIAEKQTQQK